jgi:hypothetical protein
VRSPVETSFENEMPHGETPFTEDGREKSASELVQPE